MLYGSCSFAGFSLSTQEEIYNNCQKLYTNGLISQQTLDYVYNNIGSTQFSGTNNNYIIFIGQGTRYNGGNNGRMQKLSTTRSLYIIQPLDNATSIGNYTNDSSNTLYTMWSNSSGTMRVSTTSNGNTSWGNFPYNDAVDGFYCYTTIPISTRLLTLGAGEEIGGSYLVYNGPTFTPSANGSIEVIASNGVTEIMTRLPFSYTGNRDWTLGYLSDYSDVYSIFGYFGPMFVSGDQLWTESYQNIFSYNIYGGTQNGGLIFDSSTGKISIKREKLVNMQGYNLLLTYIYRNGESSSDIGSFNYYAYFFNLSISSGDLVSPDINSTVDIGMLNALDDYFSYDSGEAFALSSLFSFSGDFLSGDFLSGDIYGKIGYNDYFNNNNTFSTTLYSIYHRILGAITELDTSSYIEFVYRGNTYKIYANDFHIPDGILKTFVASFIMFLMAIGIIKRLVVLFKKMAILDFVGISSSFDIDDSNFL